MRKNILLVLLCVACVAVPAMAVDRDIHVRLLDQDNQLVPNARLHSLGVEAPMMRLGTGMLSPDGNWTVPLDGHVRKVIIEIEHPTLGLMAVDTLVPPKTDVMIILVTEDGELACKVLPMAARKGSLTAGMEARISGSPQPPPRDPGTEECLVAGEADIDIELLTDTYGSETTWEVVVHGPGGAQLCAGGPYASNTLYHEVCCVPDDGCYDFIIYDAFGDGLYSPGIVEVYYETVLQGSISGNFGYDETIASIGPGCVPDPGACCVHDECVGTMIEAECDALGGIWYAFEDCATFVCIPWGCEAGTLVGQDAMGYTASHTTDEEPGYMRAESYTLPETGTITDVHWWGGGGVYSGGWAPCEETGEDQLVNIGFWADSGGAPAGAPTCYYPDIPYTKTLVVGVAPDYTTYYMEVLLTEPCYLQSGWVSIQGSSADGCWMLWSRSPEGDGDSYCDLCGDPVLADMSYCLTGTFGELTGACCDQASGPGADCIDDVTNANCAYDRWVPLTACADLVPPCGESPTGACCDYDTGDCNIMTAAACDASGGYYQGDMSSCDPNPCPQPLCPPYDTIVGQSIDLGTSSVPYCESDWLEKWDDFDTGDEDICDVHWWGLPLDLSNAPCEDLFNIYVVGTDGEGHPDYLNPLCTWEGVAPTHELYGLLWGAYEIWYYHFVPDTCCTAHSGWLSIQSASSTTGGGSDECVYAWMPSYMGSGGSWLWDFSVWELQPDIEHSWCLTREHVPVYGACCDDATGICVDDVEVLECEGRWQETTCALMDPPCVPMTGACCEPDGSCTVTLEGDCVDPNVFQGAGTDCDPNLCPTPGDDCNDPYVVTLPAQLDFTDTGNTTCGRGNDYSSTCLGSYDGGEEIIYEVVVTEDVCVVIDMTTTFTWTGMALHDTCPLDPYTCMYEDTTSGSGGITLGPIFLAVGTYYVQVDSWPSPDCIDFDLAITACPDWGACCVGLTCTDVANEAECDGMGGDFYHLEECATFDCPPPNDDCADAEVITVVAGATVSTPGTVVGATTDSPEDPCVMYSTEKKNVWYSFTGTGNTMVISTCNAGTNIDTKVAVYCKGCEELVCIGGNDDECDAFYWGASTVEAADVADQYFICTQYSAEYLVSVGNYSETSTEGPFVLDIIDSGEACEVTIDCAPPAGACCYPDDSCADEMMAQDCIDGGGTFLGGGTNCDEDCNGDGLSDLCQMANCPPGNAMCDDCDENGIMDVCDVADCTTEPWCQDCQPNGIPDVCELGCPDKDRDEAVMDPGFEDGTPNAFWTEGSDNFGTPLCDEGSCGTGGGTGPHSGAWWCWFGGIAAAETGFVEQTLTLPVGADTLTFYLEICAVSGADTDYMDVLIDGNIIATFVEADAATYATYALVTLDISAYADDGSHLLRFYGNQPTGTSNFFVDDVSIEYTPPVEECENDCNANEVPDECDPDADGDGIPDDCDTCTDTDGDGYGDPGYPFNTCTEDECPANPCKSVDPLCGCATVCTTVDCAYDATDCPFMTAFDVERDGDGDGTVDCIDGCPEDPDKIEPGVCGCGVADVDTDGDVDGFGMFGDAGYDCLEECDNDPWKIVPGVCGCGVPDVDTDGDGVLDCLDGCPTDPMKSLPMVCGCNVGPMDGFNIEQDTDADSIPDCVDECPGEDDLADVNQNGVQDCLEDEFIPTVSEWGLVVLALLLLVGAKVYFSRRRARTA